jgi:hypothetical protein
MDGQDERKKGSTFGNVINGEFYEPIEISKQTSFHMLSGIHNWIGKCSIKRLFSLLFLL